MTKTRDKIHFQNIKVLYLRFNIRIRWEKTNMRFLYIDLRLSFKKREINILRPRV